MRRLSDMDEELEKQRRHQVRLECEASAQLWNLCVRMQLVASQAGWALRGIFEGQYWHLSKGTCRSIVICRTKPQLSDLPSRCHSTSPPSQAPRTSFVQVQAINHRRAMVAVRAGSQWARPLGHNHSVATLLLEQVSGLQDSRARFADRV